jgi:pectate lyase
MQHKSLIFIIVVLITGVFHWQSFSVGVDGPIGWAAVGPGVTGGDGSTVVTVTNQGELESYVGRSDKYIVQVQGTIEIAPVGKEVAVGSNTTIIGLGADATLHGGGLGIKGVTNVIVRNLTIKDAYVDWEGKTTDYDAIEINNSQNVWIDHCDLSHFDDGLIDVKNAADYVTVSWCHFHNHNKVMLIGASDDAPQDVGHLNTTVHHNWFDGQGGNGIGQRLPRARFGKVHVYNNYYNDVIYSGVMAGLDANMLVENNYFLNVPDPYPVVRGATGGNNVLNAYNNILINSPGRADTRGTAFKPTDYYSYDLDDSADVPAIVMAGAGVGIIAAVEDNGHSFDNTPHASHLAPNYPNPFNPMTTIQYRLEGDGFSSVSLRLYNLLGKEVRTLVDESQKAGAYTVIWDGKNNAGQQVPSGVYAYQLQVGEKIWVGKMTLLR